MVNWESPVPACACVEERKYPALAQGLLAQLELFHPRQFCVHGTEPFQITVDFILT